MRATSSSAALFIAGVLAVGFAAVPADSQTRRAPARSGTEPQEQAEPRERAQPRAPEPTERAQPRSPAPAERAQPRADESQRRGPQAQASQDRARPRRGSAPPPRAVPPRYYVFPRAYYFPPVSLHRGYYYHPYFGFYYGPYYGPFYPYPGPPFGQLHYSAGAIRTRVKPVETQVYVNGYYAGIADDFDGVFQRLHIPAGQHEIELHLDGYRNHRQKVYVSPGDTLEITHHMEPLGSSEESDPVSPPQTLPGEWPAAPPPASDERKPSPFGILAIRVEPADAQIFLDDEGWTAGEGRAELVIHVEAGWHRLEVRKEGYQTFRTEVELSEGATTRLNVKLPR